MRKESNLRHGPIDWDGVRVLVNAYEAVMLKKKKIIPPSLGAGQYTVETFEEALRVIFRDYYKWDPIQIRNALTAQDVEEMKLSFFLSKLDAPPEVDRKKELYYVAWALYPNTRHESEIELISRYYDKMMSGEAQRFPKGYFDNEIGELRAALIFKIIMNRHIIPKYEIRTTEQAYMFFARKDIMKIMEDCKIKALISLHYGNPLNYLHRFLPADKRSDRLYFEAFTSVKGPADRWGKFALSDETVKRLNDGKLPDGLVKYRQARRESAERNTAKNVSAIECVG